MRAAIIAVLFLLPAAACSAPPVSTSTPPSSAVPTLGTAAPFATTVAPAPAATSTPAGAAQPFLRIQLTDVRSGERFTLGGSGGRVVIVEGMAVW